MGTLHQRVLPAHSARAASLVEGLSLAPGNLVRIGGKARLVAVARTRNGRWRHWAAASLLHTVLAVRSQALDQLLHPSCTQGSMRAVGPEPPGGSGGRRSRDRPAEGLVTAPSAQVNLQLHEIRQLDQ
jgi:hypothetical protein